MDTNTEDKQIQKEVIRLFCLIIRKDPKAVNDVSTACSKCPSMLNRWLEFFCGSIHDYADTRCACQVDHELYTYVSHAGIDTELFDHILASIEDGKCRHYNDIPKEDEETIGPSPTSVQLIHAAAAVGCVPVLEILLPLAQTGKRLREAIRSLNASPLHLAILFKQRQYIKTIIESPYEPFETFCNSLFRYAERSQTNPNLIKTPSVSIIKLCLMMNDKKTAQNILQRTIFRTTWLFDVINSDSECFNALILPHVRNHLVHKATIILATLNNQPKILEILLDSNLTSGIYTDIYTVRFYTIFDIANTVNHSECADILQSHNIKGSTLKKSSPFLAMLEIIQSLKVPELANVLLRKIWLKKPVAERKEECKALVVDPVTYKRGIGLRTLIEICGDVEVKGPDGITPLALALKPDSSPQAILDVLYFNPILTDFEKVRTITECHLRLFDREKVNQITILALAIARDLKNYSLQYGFRLRPKGFSFYEGSMAILLLECGYDIRNDEIVRSSYTQLLQGGHKSTRERKIREMILKKIESELNRPKSLKEYCRNSLRRAFHGIKLHLLMNTNLVPTSIKNFILLESRLKQRYDQRLSYIMCKEDL